MACSNLMPFSQAAEDPSRITAGDIPFYAVPTNFGTGSEVTGDAVLIDNKTGEPISLRSEYLRSAGIFVDKENFVGLSVRPALLSFLRCRSTSLAKELSV